MCREYTVGALRRLVLCLWVVAFASYPSKAAAEETTKLAAAFLGTWCGEDGTARWRQTNLADGTYTQVNQPNPGIEASFATHEEFGTWSIDGKTLTKSTQGIKYNDTGIRLIDPPWPFSFEINKLSADELITEHVQLGLTFRSTRDCAEGT